MTFARRLSTVFAIGVLAVSGAVAQDGPPPFVFVLESTMSDSDVPIWTLAMQDVAAAHTSHEDGNTWAAYRALTGGPEARFRFFSPLGSLAEMDDWPSNRRIVTEAMGADAAGAALRVLDAGARSHDRLMSYVPEVSRPPAPRPAPYRNVWVLTVTIDAGKMTEYASLLKRVKKAHDDAEDGVHWAVYANAIGGNDMQVELYMPFDRFAELDGWPGTYQVLAARYGVDDAARIIEAMDAISETEGEIWNLVPDLSALPD